MKNDLRLKLTALAKYFYQNNMIEESKDIKSILKLSQQELEFDKGLEVHVDVHGFNPFLVKGKETTITIKGSDSPPVDGDTFRSSTTSKKVKPVVLSEDTKIYFVEDKYDLPCSITMIDSAYTAYDAEHAFGKGDDGIISLLNNNFNPEFDQTTYDECVNVRTEQFYRTHDDHPTQVLQDYFLLGDTPVERINVDKVRSSIDSLSTQYKIFSFKTSELSDNFEEEYKEYLRNDGYYNESKRVEITNNFKKVMDPRNEDSQYGPMWWDESTDTVYYTSDESHGNPVKALYRFDIYNLEESDFADYVKNTPPEEFYRRECDKPNWTMDGYLIPAVYISLGCGLFAYGTALANDGSLITFIDESLPEEGLLNYKYSSSCHNFSEAHNVAYIASKDKVTNPKWKKQVDKVDGCMAKEIYEVQYSKLKKRDGDVPPYSQPKREPKNDDPKPLSFSDYKKRTEDSNYWGLPDPDYPNIEPGDSWENICKIYPNHPKCKNNKSNFSYNPSDEFEISNTKHKSPFGGGYMSEESISNSDIAKKYVSHIGGISNIKSTTSIGGQKMYLIPDEKTMMRAIKGLAD